MKKYRFFMHFNKNLNKMTVHFRNKCYFAKDVTCEVETNTKWSTRQPRLILRGYCTKITVRKDLDYILIE